MRLLNASGCLDALTAPDVARTLDVYVTKTVTPLPREGNAPVRIAETEVGMLNAIGLANPGVEAFVAEHLPRLDELRMPLWVSVGGFSLEDYVHVARRVGERDEVEALELNLSCPNVDEVPDDVWEVVAAVRGITSKPLYAKLSAAVADLGATARAAESAGADGLSLVNTIRGLALDERTLRPVLARATGGLSGPALRPVALAAVHTCFREARLPIVGMGGVATGRHALELVVAGATDVAVGTALFADPGAAARIRSELEAELAAFGFVSPDNAIGAAHAPEDSTLDPRSRLPLEKPLHTAAKLSG
ncbi:MAG TPA: dihydroorotate dehydrogenase [Gaiellaceae bacterium]|nr:dihydroorotate dehydrogenase [Gaiellaceae bacterium]